MNSFCQGDGVHQRFVQERKRVGLRSGAAFAEKSGVSQSTVSRIESGATPPSADALAALANLGADVNFVLTGQRAAAIDLDLLGLCEAGLRSAYTEVRPEKQGFSAAVRARAVAQVYNRVVEGESPASDIAGLVRESASAWVEAFNDPGDPELLDRAMLRSPVAADSAAGPVQIVSASGIGTKAAGKRIYEAGSRSTEKK